MKKLHIKIFFLFAILLGTAKSVAQIVEDKDEKIKTFEEAPNAEARFQFFFETQNRYKQNSPYDWLKGVNLFLNNSSKIDDSVSIRKYMVMQSQLHYDIGDYDKSVAIAKELFNQKQKLDSVKIGIILDLLDYNYGKLELSGKQIDARTEKKKLNLVDEVYFYDIYANVGMYRKAMRDYIRTKSKSIEEDDHFGLAKYNNNVGNYLRLDKSIPIAITNLTKALGFINVYLNDGTVDKTEGELAKGTLLKGVIQGNIGKCKLLQGEFEEASKYLEEGVTALTENGIGEYSINLKEDQLALAESYLKLDQLRKAKELLDVEISKFHPKLIMKRNRLWALYYDKTGNFKNALRYLKSNDSIQYALDLRNTAVKKQQLRIIAEKDLENSIDMIEEQKKDNEKFKNEMLAQDQKINFVFISLIFTLLGFTGLVYAYLKSIKNQRLIAEQKHIIENSLVEKDSLLKEIHHRVKNNLQMVSSLLSLQTKNTRSKAAIVALEEGKSRVKAMALIHQKLYQNDDLSVIEMQGYIESLINSVQSVYKKGGHNINITIDAEGVELDIDRAIPFGLILNELVSNSFKYAFPDGDENGKVYIHLRKNGELGFFEYTDNGVGLPEDTDQRAKSSMGIRLMNRLVNQLQSDLKIDKNTDGVRFWFNFK